MGFVLGRALMDNLISPLELKIEEWKKVASQLDKDHAKGTRQCRAVPCSAALSCGPKFIDERWATSSQLYHTIIKANLITWQVILPI